MAAIHPEAEREVHRRRAPGVRHWLILLAVHLILVCLAVGTAWLQGVLRAEEAATSPPSPGAADEIEDGGAFPPGAEAELGAGEAIPDASGRGEERFTNSSPVRPEPEDRRNGPILAIVIDDWGYGWAAAADFLALDVPLNIAVIPYLPYSERHAREAAARGHQVILHLPMEPLGEGWELGRGTVTTAMAADEIGRDVRAALAAVPFASGINNHMGSKATADPRVMAQVLLTVKEQGLFFLDSRTTSASVAAAVGAELGVPVLENDRFIDTDSSPERVKERILAAARVARSRGYAVAIGHVRPGTYAGLVASLAELEREGVRLAYLDEVLARAYPDRARK